MHINNESCFEILKKYLSSYRHIFHKRSFEIFLLIIISIIVMQKMQSIKFIYEKFISKFWNKSLNSIYFFLKSDKYSLEEMMRTTTRIAMSLIPNELRKKVTVYLIIDDTLQPKFGEKFDNRYKLFDHAKHNGTLYMNGHQIVSIAMAIPIFQDNGIRYITIPLGYKLYDKTATKLELAKNLVCAVMPELTESQVIILCDSWYTKKNFLEVLSEYDNLKIIGGLRSDTALYDLKPKPTGKRGRPRKKGERLDYKNFEFHEENDFFVATVKCMTNLFKNPVFITVTTTDIEKFSSVRMYLSTVAIEEVKMKYNKDEKKKKLNLYDIYKLRWSIEVIFFEQKTFWSFGQYMVRRKIAIEKYINLIGVAYSAMILIPFINKSFKEFQFCSPQETKYAFGEIIRQDLILCNLLKIPQIKENLSHILELRPFKGIDNLAS